MHIYTQMHIHNTYLNIHVYTSIYMCIHALTFIYKCVHALYTHVCISVCIYICKNV